MLKKSCMHVGKSSQIHPLNQHIKIHTGESSYECDTWSIYRPSQPDETTPQILHWSEPSQM